MLACQCDDQRVFHYCHGSQYCKCLSHLLELAVLVMVYEVWCTEIQMWRLRLRPLRSWLGPRGLAEGCNVAHHKHNG